MSKETVQIEGHKLMYHVGAVANWLDGKPPAPIYVEIGPINACNHKCNFCAFDYLKSRGSAIDKQVLTKTLKDMADMGVKSIMLCGEGEPLMYAPLAEVIEKGKGFGLDIAITSNGVLFTPDKAKAILPNISWIKFSIDAGSEETHAKVHGTTEADFPKIIENISFACAHKKANKLSCAIGCQMVVTDETVQDAEKLVLAVKDIGVSYCVFKPYVKHPDSINKQCLTHEDYDKILSKLSDTYSRDDFRVIFRDDAFQETEKDTLAYEECYGINFMTLIDALGNVIPCSVFYDNEEYCYGNINEQGFKEIWESERRKEIVKKVYARGCADCRNGCRLNFINKYLDIVKNRKKTHINFI